MLNFPNYLLYILMAGVIVVPLLGYFVFKYSQNKALKVTAFIVLSILFLFSISVWYLMITEPYRNDNILSISSSKWAMDVSSKSPFELTSEKLPVECPKRQEFEKFDCQKFELERADVYYVYSKKLGASFYSELSLIAKYRDGVMEKIVSKELNFKYPSNSFSNVRSDGESVYFEYSGFRNPLKYIKLTPNSNL